MALWREAKFGMFIHWGVYAVPAAEAARAHGLKFGLDYSQSQHWT